MAKINLKDLSKKRRFTVINTLKQLGEFDWRISVFSKDLQKSVTEHLNKNSLNSEIERIFYQGSPLSVFLATPEMITFVKKNNDLSKSDYIIFRRPKNSKKPWRKWVGNI